LAQGDQAGDVANCAQQLARNVWSKLAASLKVKLVSMNWPNAFESALQDQSRCELCPLSRVKAGVAVRIKQLCASPEVQNRLREIGLGEDQIIKLLTSHTNFICQVCNARLAISEQLAQLILVEPLRATVV
jgi:Fe2+ transport system protein FeoA